MRLKIYVLIFIFGVTVGAFSSYSYFKSDLHNYFQLKAVSKNLSYELNDYIRLKSNEEKFKRAEEILGKVMVVFLANLALHVESDVARYFDEVDRGDGDAKEAKLLKETGKLNIAEEKLQSDSKKLSSGYRSKEKNKENKFKYSYPGTGLKNSAAYFATAPLVQNFNHYLKIAGTYEGVVRIFAGKYKDEVHEVELNSEFDLVEEKLKGSYSLILIKEGNPYSRNSGNGENKSIRLDLEDKNFILLGVSPNSFFRLKRSVNGGLKGTYYSNNKEIGFVSLRRID